MLLDKDLAQELHESQTLTELGSVAVMAAQRLLGASAAAFVPAPPFAPFGMAATIFHESIDTKAVREAGERVIPVIAREFLLAGTQVDWSHLVDLRSTFGSNYVDGSEANNTYYRPFKIERQVIGWLSSSNRSPLGLLAFARSLSERAFSERELTLGELLRAEVSRACQNLQRQMLEGSRTTLGALTASLAQPAALFDTYAFLIWASAAAELEWARPGSNGVSQWRELALRCSVTGKTELTSGGLRVVRHLETGSRLPLFTVLRSPSSDWTANWGLTRREATIAEHLARGRANKEIAQVLDCSPRTVEQHVAKILQKSGARSRAELAGSLFAKLA